MHELGIVFHIIDSLKEVGEENHLKQIAGVTLEVGEVSGVLEDYLQSCWRWASDRTELLKGASLTVEQIPAVTFCEDCKKTYSTTEAPQPRQRAVSFLTCSSVKVSFASLKDL